MTREEAIAYGKDYYRDLITACCEIDEKHKEFVRMAIQALSQEPCESIHGSTYGGVSWGGTYKPQQPCDDAISRDAVIKDFTPLHNGEITLESAIDYLHKTGWMQEHDRILSERQSGKWILLDECANSGYYCSRCQKKLVKEGWSDTVKKIKYCPNCGAKMGRGK